MAALLDGLPWELAAAAGILLGFLSVAPFLDTKPMLGQLRVRKIRP